LITQGIFEFETCLSSFQPIFSFTSEGVAKLALETKLDDFSAGSVSRKPTYPIGHRLFAKNSNPTPKSSSLVSKASFATPSSI
jgi:hypothetical protein